MTELVKTKRDREFENENIWYREQKIKCENKAHGNSYNVEIAKAKTKRAEGKKKESERDQTSDIEREV